MDVRSPGRAGAPAETCERLVAALPDIVAGQDRRPVRPDDGRTAAWGDPAIVLRCGVASPPGFDEVATCQVTDGVGWFIPQQQITGAPSAIRMTTVDRSPRVEVRLPAEYFPPAEAMVDLAPAITEHVRQRRPC